MSGFLCQEVFPTPWKKVMKCSEARNALQNQKFLNYVLTQQSNNNLKKKPFDLVGVIKKILPFMSQVQVHFRDAG